MLPVARPVATDFPPRGPRPNCGGRCGRLFRRRGGCPTGPPATRGGRQFQAVRRATGRTVEDGDARYCTVHGWWVRSRPPALAPEVQTYSRTSVPTWGAVPVPSTQRSRLVSSKAHTGRGPELGELAASRGSGWVRSRRVAGSHGAEAQINWVALGWP